jgi:hypothetical protein
MEAPNIESLTLDTLEIVAGPHFEKYGYPHAEWAYLRKHAPVYWYDRENVVPFWTITKHADIVEVARQPKIFLNAPRLLAMTKDQSVQGGELLYHNLLNMDPPEHAKYLVNRSFTPRAVRSLLREVEEIANDLIERAFRVASQRRRDYGMRLRGGHRREGTAPCHRGAARRSQSRSHETHALDQRSNRIGRSGIRAGCDTARSAGTSPRGSV